MTTVGDIGFEPQEEEDQDGIPRLEINTENPEEFRDSFLETLEPLADDLWSLRWNPRFRDQQGQYQQGQYRYMIRTFEEWSLDLENLNVGHIYNELLADCDDDEVSAECDLLILINMHFIDYWFVNRRLEELEIEKGEDHQDTRYLNIIAEFFDFKKRQLENQPSSPEKEVALELLDLARENEFLCSFDVDNRSEETRPDLLCKIHVFYTMRAHNGELSPERTAQLQQLEAKLENL